MDLYETEIDKDFRASARDWLMTNVPKTSRPEDVAGALEFDRQWQKTQFEGGWAGVNWPESYGGRELSGYHYMIWLQEKWRARAPSEHACYTGLHHAGPTLIACGSEAQKQQHLPNILRGEETWCQGFSEPNAGSDLANMKCTGVIDGDEIVVNGHKTWTTNAHFADFQELVVRTEPGSKRHKGLTWIIGDMRAPGVTVRPIKTMTGDSEVNDTFFDDARFPIKNVVGGIGNGWAVAMSTLSAERGTGFINNQMEVSEWIEDLIQIARKTYLADGRLAIKDDRIAQRLAFLKAQTVAIKSLTLSMLGEIERRGAPGPEGSIMKVLVTTVYQEIFRLASDILGLDFLNYNYRQDGNHWPQKYLWSWVLTIAGGSNEIQRDIIATRVLGLPRGR